MGFIKSTSRKIFTGFHPSKWIARKELKQGADTIKDLYKDAKNISKTSDKTSQSFEDYVKSNNLSKDDLLKQSKQSKQLSFFYSIAALILFFYGLFLLFHTSFSSFLLCMILVIYLSASAFRENIAYYQIKNKKLKISISTWARDTFLGKK